IAGQAGRAQLLDRRRTIEGVIGGGDVEARLRPGDPGAVARRVVLIGQCLAARGGAGEPPGVIPLIADSMAVVGVLRLGAAAPQVVGEGDIIGGGGVAAFKQAVQVVVGERDGIAAALAVADEVARLVVVVLLVVGGRRDARRARVRVAQLHPAVVAVVLVGGAIALGVGEGERQAVVAPGIGGVGLFECVAHRALPALDGVVGVVVRFGSTVATLAHGQVLGDQHQPVQIVVGIVGDRHRRGRR